jgi:hypothetical protein
MSPVAIWTVDADTGTAIIAMTATIAINAYASFILVSPQFTNLGSVNLFSAPHEVHLKLLPVGVDEPRTP